MSWMRASSNGKVGVLTEKSGYWSYTTLYVPR
jgi:hypothetical protein